MATLPRSSLGLLILATITCAKQCYYPNGTLVSTLYDIMPCNSIGSVDSMCCALNRTSGPDSCADNGLCSNGLAYFRDYCTDPTWSSPNCLKNVCNSGTLNNTYSQVYQCSDGNWCCTDGCCQSSTASKFTLAATLVPTSSTASSTSTVTVTATSTAKAASSNTGVVAGLGAALGVIVLLCIGGGFWFRRQLKQARMNNVGGDEGSASAVPMMGYQDVKTMPTPNARHEVGGDDRRYELSDHSGVER